MCRGKLAVIAILILVCGVDTAHGISGRAFSIEWQDGHERLHSPLRRPSSRGSWSPSTNLGMSRRSSASRSNGSKREKGEGERWAGELIDGVRGLWQPLGMPHAARVAPRRNGVPRLESRRGPDAVGFPGNTTMSRLKTCWSRHVSRGRCGFAPIAGTPSWAR